MRFWSDFNCNCASYLFFVFLMHLYKYICKDLWRRHPTCAFVHAFIPVSSNRSCEYLEVEKSTFSFMLVDPSFASWSIFRKKFTWTLGLIQKLRHLNAYLLLLVTPGTSCWCRRDACFVSFSVVLFRHWSLYFWSGETKLLRILAVSRADAIWRKCLLWKWGSLRTSWRVISGTINII